VTPLAAKAHALLLERKQTVATAESLTAGLLGAALTDVAGSSATYRGGVIVYATDLKAVLLGVPTDLLAARGAVDPAVAIAMAVGVRDRLAADWGVALTGVAGPDPQDGKSPGLVYVGVAGPAGAGQASELRLTGDRNAVRTGARDAALRVLCDSVAAGE
jgi:nicotinamide-nucleotide amidase